MGVEAVEAVGGSWGEKHVALFVHDCSLIVHGMNLKGFIFPKNRAFQAMALAFLVMISDFLLMIFTDRTASLRWANGYLYTTDPLVCVINPIHRSFD